MKRVGDILSVLFDEQFKQKADRYSDMFSCWKDLAEKNRMAAAADHSRIKAVEKGIIWIEVDHPGWKQILLTKEGKLLSDFQYRFPDMHISGISIVLSKTGFSDDSKGNKISPAEKLPPPKSAGVQENNFSLDDIKDGELKKVLERLEKSIAEREATRSIH